MSRVDRLAASLGVPTEDLKWAMRKAAGPEQRISTMSVRSGGTRTFKYRHWTNIDHVAHALDLKGGGDELRRKMRQLAMEDGVWDGRTWTVSVRVW